MSFISIISSRYAPDAPLSTDLFSDIVSDLNFLNTNGISAVDAGGAPLVQNGSFELDANGTVQPSGWVFTAGVGGSGNVTNTYYGHGAQSFVVNRDNVAGHSGGTLVSANYMNISPIQAYKIRWQYRILTGGSSSRTIGWIQWYTNTGSTNGTTTFFDTAASSTVDDSAVFCVYGYNLIPPAGSFYCKINFSLGDASVTPLSATSQCIDGISMTLADQFVTAFVGGGLGSSFTVPSGVTQVKLYLSDSNAGALGLTAYSLISVNPADTSKLTTDLSSNTAVAVQRPSSGSTVYNYWNVFNMSIQNVVMPFSNTNPQYFVVFY